MNYRLMRDFGISQSTYANLPDEEERENYIILCMKRKIDEEMEKWKKEVETHEKGIQKFEKAARERSERFMRAKADIFKWLKIKTK